TSSPMRSISPPTPSTTATGRPDSGRLSRQDVAAALGRGAGEGEAHDAGAVGWDGRLVHGAVADRDGRLRPALGGGGGGGEAQRRGGRPQAQGRAPPIEEGEHGAVRARQVPERGRLAHE